MEIDECNNAVMDTVILILILHIICKILRGTVRVETFGVVLFSVTSSLNFILCKSITNTYRAEQGGVAS